MIACHRSSVNDPNNDDVTMLAGPELRLEDHPTNVKRKLLSKSSNDSDTLQPINLNNVIILN